MLVSTALAATLHSNSLGVIATITPQRIRHMPVCISKIHSLDGDGDGDCCLQPSAPFYDNPDISDDKKTARVGAKGGLVRLGTS